MSSQHPVHTPTPLDIRVDAYSMGTGEDDWMEEPPQETAKLPRVLRPADPALRDWLLHHRDEFLRILLWRHGRGDFGEHCGNCGEKDPLYRCRECFGGVLTCQTCCVELHQESPFHSVEVIFSVNSTLYVQLKFSQFWNGAYFQKCSLKMLGLRFQLGHPPRQSCDRPIPARHDFLIIHHNGLQEVSLDYCGCRRTADAYYAQLLRAGLYPATTDNPRTCATLQCLEQYHCLTLHGKITGWDFYRSLETQTNATGVKPPDRYQVFLRIAREYRHLLSLKHGGRGYDSRGVLGTAAGELALRCPACPRPGVNLPDDWQNAPPSQA
ncbi:CxC2 domain-containing protein [Mycena indigotica]|uniref:CxC2 domain-containing protein n=1 Tax=Mycena indigotica TaxID=2126181 RepID=A0A8H6S5X9_9AGAR|nr:CxC2 domain-containing protein [Mycena indigotica]KAF7292676.1 CxC2 domain-containing protein [Mycena indigotica]